MIRMMNKDDIKDIIELLKEVDLVHHDGRPDIFKIGTKYNSDELLNMVDDKLNPIFVYEKDNKVVAHAFCNTVIHENDNVLTNIKTLYIDDICVKEEYRNLGIATNLYEYVMKYAKDNNYYNVTLNVWDFNDSAYSFYKKMGMTPLKVTMEQIIK